MPGVIFSHPQFIPTGSYTLDHYTLQYSAPNTDGSPNYYGPWNTLTNYSSYTKNTDIVDPNGTVWTLYRVVPTLNVILGDGSQGQISLSPTRPFLPTQPLYDMQISALIDTFRAQWMDDIGTRQTDSTLVQENTGTGVLPFITDSSTNRFYLSFLPNDKPVKFNWEDILVFLGTTKSNAAALIPWTDYNPAYDYGYIDFKTVPPTNDYLRVEYTSVKYSNDEIRKALLNAVSELSLYGINTYAVLNSNNLYYLNIPLASRDLAALVCQIAYKNMLSAKIYSSFEQAESWKDGQVEYTADPSRSIQAAQAHLADIDRQMKEKSSRYIYNTRNYYVKGEFDSFFDVTGVLPVYALIASVFDVGSMGFWL